MPSAVNINGRVTRRPGVKAAVDASRLAGITVDINRLALVGEFPELAQGEVRVFNSARSLADFAPANAKLQDYVKYIFNGSNDPRVTGGPSAVLLSSPVQTTAAQKVFVDDAAADSLVVKSSVYGATGNRTRVKIDEGASSTTGEMDVSGVVGGPFTVGETVTGGTSGATGVIEWVDFGANIRLQGLSGTFAVGETITGSLSGATATVDTFRRDNFNIEIERDGVTETYPRSGSGVVGSGRVLIIRYLGTEATSVSLVALTGQVRILQVKDDLAAGGTFVPTELAFDGPISVTPDVAPGGGTETFDVTIFGINKDTGLADSEVMPQWVDTDGATKVSTKSWSSVTSIVSAVSGGAATATYEVAVDAFRLETANYSTVADVIDRINTIGATYTATSDSAQTSKISLDEIDRTFPPSQILWDGTTRTTRFLRADLRAILLELAASGLVTATRATSASLPPTPSSTAVLLAGGTEAASVSLADWQAAFTALRTQDVQIVWLEDTDLATQQEGRAHCVYMAGEGEGECNLWTGALANETRDQLRSRAIGLNTRHVQLTGQQVEVTNSRGETVVADPNIFALMLAGMQSSTAIGTSLTKKYPAVTDAFQSATWDPEADADEMLKQGLVFLTRQPGRGLKVERNITTYLVDDNPVFSEGSTNESLNTSVRDLRTRLDIIIGDSNVPTTAGRVLSLARAALRQQIVDQTIKAFDPEAVSVEDIGDLFRINYEFVPIEPVNFIIVAASAVRQLSSAA